MTYFDPDKHPELEPQRTRSAPDEHEDSVPDITKKEWGMGDRVLAPWGRACLYPGTINEIGENTLYVIFDDGDRAWVARNQVRSLFTLAVGHRIKCRWRGGTRYYFGTITEIKGDLLHIKYEDGDSEWNVVGMIMVPSGLSPGIWDYFWLLGWLGFLIPLIIGIVFIFRFWCGK
jgi:hypothetical protein